MSVPAAGVSWRFIVKRYSVNKHKSAKSFRHNVGHTKAINMRAAPMRGGIRL